MKAIKVLVSTLALLVIGLYVSGHGYIVAGMQETYFRGWKNSNIDDIEFRDLRTIAAAESPSPWIYKPIWNADFSAEDAAWHEEYMSAAFLVFKPIHCVLNGIGKGLMSTRFPIRFQRAKASWPWSLDWLFKRGWWT